MIQCAGCGSNLVYDIARKKMYCKACGNEYEPESVDKDEDSEERKLMELTVFICPQCGGEIYSTDESATGFCSYCGAATMPFQPAEKREKTGLCDTVCGDEGHVQGIICHSHEEGDIRAEQTETQTKCAGVPWNLHALLAV